MGLKWPDLDWYNFHLNMKRAFQHGRFYEPKSETSKRKIDLGQTVMRQLRKWKIACPPNDMDLVFPNDTGKPIDNKKIGDEVWERFKRGKEKQEWYYRNLVQSLHTKSENKSYLKLFKLLRDEVENLFGTR